MPEAVADLITRPTATPIENLDMRSRRTSEDVRDVKARMGKIEEHVGDLREGFGEIKGSLTTLVRIQTGEAEARRDRDVREAALLDAERTRRAGLWRAFLKIATPLVVAIGVAIAGIIYGGHK